MPLYIGKENISGDVTWVDGTRAKIILAESRYIYDQDGYIRSFLNGPSQDASVFFLSERSNAGRDAAVYINNLVSKLAGGKLASEVSDDFIFKLIIANIAAPIVKGLFNELIEQFLPEEWCYVEDETGYEMIKYPLKISP